MYDVVRVVFVREQQCVCCPSCSYSKLHRGAGGKARGKGAINDWEKHLEPGQSISDKTAVAKAKAKARRVSRQTEFKEKKGIKFGS